MNKKYIIIGLTLLLVVLCGLIAFELVNNVEYEKLVLPSGSTMEVPNDMKLVGNNSGIYVYENDDCAVIIFNSGQASVVDMALFAEDKLEIFGNDFERNTTVTDTQAYGCNLKGDYYAYFVGNNETHDNIIVFAKNKDVGDHIMKSIKYTVAASNQEDGNDVADTADSNTQSVYAYTSDGTPLYSKADADSYMQSKYGDVDYHVRDNGYINIDNNEYLNPDGSIKED